MNESSGFFLENWRYGSDLPRKSYNTHPHYLITSPSNSLNMHQTGSLLINLCQLQSLVSDYTRDDTHILRLTPTFLSKSSPANWNSNMEEFWDTSSVLTWSTHIPHTHTHTQTHTHTLIQVSNFKHVNTIQLKKAVQVFWLLLQLKSLIMLFHFLLFLFFHFYWSWQSNYVRW